MGGGWVGFEFLQDFGTAELGQEHVEDDEVGEFGGSLRDGFLAVTSADDLVAGFGEGTLSSDSEELAVFDEKDGFHRRAELSVSLSAWVGRS